MRNFNPAQKLALWFVGEVLHDEKPFSNPKIWQHMAQAKLLLKKVEDGGRGYEVARVKETILELVRLGKNPESLFAVEWLAPDKQTWYMKCSDPIASAPPIYETLDYQLWSQQHANAGV